MNPGILLVLASLAGPPTVNFEQAVDEAIPSYSLEQPQDSEPSPAFRAMGWAVIGSASADIASTHYALRGGGREANPVAPGGIKGIAAVKAATTVAVLWGTDELRKSGHEKTALWLRVATVAAWGYATAHNLRVGRGLR